MKKYLVILFTIFILQGVFADIYQLHIAGPINSITQEYIEDSFDEISLNRKAGLIIITMDTPGGLDTSMRGIIKKILNSPVPVVTFVSPQGARAASAGLFITLSSDLAVMAPGTNMGAAHPVSAMGGKVSKTMNEKVTNDAIAYLKSIASEKKKNLKMVEDAIRESKSYTASECLKGGLIDLIADDVADLLQQLKAGKTIAHQGKIIEIDTDFKKIIRLEMSFRHRFLKTITNPNIAYFLLLIGIAGLYLEFTHPGGIIPGVLGGISLLLAFLAFQILPINYIGIFLILLAIGLFIAEIKVQGFGILGIGGIISFFLGSVMLIDSKLAEMKPAMSIIITFSISFGLIFIFLTYKVFKSSKQKPQTGIEGMSGEVGVVKQTVNHNGGKVFIRGELWEARSFDGEEIQINSKVMIKKMEGFVLFVNKV